MIAERLKYFTRHLEKLTSDQFILENVNGYKTEFTRAVNFDHNWSRNPEEKFTFRGQGIIDTEIENLLRKSVVKVSCHCEGEFISPIFVRPKRDGSYRLILNLKSLNMNVEYHHFKMETLRSAITLMRSRLLHGIHRFT